MFISHNLSNTRYIAGNADGKIAVNYLGKIVEYGPVEEVIADPPHSYTKILKWAKPMLDSDLAEQASARPLRCAGSTFRMRATRRRGVGSTRGVPKHEPSVLFGGLP